MNSYITLLLASWALSVTGLKCWSCDNAKSVKDCLDTGRTEQCRRDEAMSCQTEVRHHQGWGGGPRIKTGCKQRLACRNNQKQNPAQCNSGRKNSVCRCCCQNNDCNKRNLLCKPRRSLRTRRPTPKKNLPVLKTAPTTKASPEKTLAQSKPTLETTSPATRKSSASSATRQSPIKTPPSTTLEIQKTPAPTPTRASPEKTPPLNSPETEKTPPPFSTRASPEKTPPLPSCAHLPIEPVNGIMECTQGTALGSVCLFACKEGFELVGYLTTECVRRGKFQKWDKKAPTCTKTRPMSMDNFIETCPSDIRRDIVIIMDSSRSIKRNEWEVMKKFVSKVIRKFDVSKEAVQFSVLRFNAGVDVKSQILFGDYADDAEGLVQAVENLPKRGGGTRLGRALKYAKIRVLTKDNREDAIDQIFVLTDGKTSDFPLLEEVSGELRRQDVEIFALGVSRNGEKQFVDQLVTMTGRSDRVLQVRDVTEDFTDNLVRQVVSKICGL